MPLFKINSRIIFFVHIPKTGGTSVENTLARVGEISMHRKPFPDWVPPQHWHAEIYETVIPKDFYDYGFLVCRNPYMRMASEYRHRAKQDGVRERGFDAWVDETLERYAADPYINYNHIRPQIEFASRCVSVFRYEEGLQAATDAVLQFCAVRKRPDVRRDNVSRRLPITATAATINSVAKFYAGDFKHFKYDPHDMTLLARNEITVVG